MALSAATGGWIMKKIVYGLIALSALSMAACGGGSSSNNSKASKESLAVALGGTGEIAIIDTQTDAIVQRYPVGTGLQSIAISPNGTKFYATDCQNPSSTDNKLWVVNVADGAKQSIDLGGAPWGVKVHPDGSKAYVTMRNDSEVAVIDTATNTVEGTIPVGVTPLGIDISPDGSRLCVANKDANTISIIDTATQDVVTSDPLIGTGEGPWEVAFSPDGLYCWVDDSTTGDVLSVYSAADATLQNSATMLFDDDFFGLQGVAFTPNGQTAFVGSDQSNDMFVVDPATLETITTISTGTTGGADAAKRMAMSSNGSTLFYSSPVDDSITVIDAADYVVKDFIFFDPGDRPNGLVLY
jgi:YVTN family beta-propeller protein